ncbi:MAG: tetratricopeptide repeat protein [Flavobacteriaceae bacterium]|nr:tetratricopeptide repeat protein [Flavobacteriaceae bacterium]
MKCVCIKILVLTVLINGYAVPSNYSNEILNQDNVFLNLKMINNKPLSLKERLLIVNRGYYFSIKSKNDSIRNEDLKQQIRLTYRKKDWELFHKYRKERLKLTVKLNDSSAHAKTLEYSGTYFKNEHRIDSAYYYYYKSFKLYDGLKDSLKAGRILINIAILQKNTHDYKGSEETSFKAAIYLEYSQNLRRRSSVYNNLGLVYEQLNDFDNSFKYHRKAFVLREQILKTPLYKIQSLNNLGILHTQNHKYEKAKLYFERAIVYKTILENSPLLKSYIIDNHAYARFKNGETKNVLTSLLEALKIREEEEHLEGIVINCIHLAEYYSETGDRVTALEYAKRAEEIAETIKDYHNYLMSIELLSSLQNSIEAKDRHFKKYVSLRDSLDQVARNHKEQFARIKFETDEKDATIKKQNRKIRARENTILIVSGIIISIVFFSGFVFIHKQKIKQRLKKELMNGFASYLIKKYSLTPENFEFWTKWIVSTRQDQLSKELYLSVDAIKSRRKSLKARIYKIQKMEGHFDKAKAINLYNEELSLYKTYTSTN